MPGMTPGASRPYRRTASRSIGPSSTRETFRQKPSGPVMNSNDTSGGNTITSPASARYTHVPIRQNSEPDTILSTEHIGGFSERRWEFSRISASQTPMQ